MLINKTTTVAVGDSCKNLKEEIENLEEFYIPRDTVRCNANNLSFVDILLGFIPQSLYNTIIKRARIREVANQILSESFIQFKIFLYNQLWKERCVAVRNWERKNGIRNNKYKRKIRDTTAVTVTSNSNTINSDNNNISQESYQSVLKKKQH